MLYGIRRVGSGRRRAAILQSNTIWAGTDVAEDGRWLEPAVGENRECLRGRRMLRHALRAAQHEGMVPDSS